MKSGLARQILLASVSGLLFPLCFPSFNVGAVAWVAFIPLHLTLLTTSPARGFWLGWWVGFLSFVTTMSWVVTAMAVYGQVPLLASYGALILLALYLGLYVALYSLAVIWSRSVFPAAIPLVSACIWVALELIRTYALTGLPWNLLGYSQYSWLPLIQFADHTGIYGISFLIILVNCSVAELLWWVYQRSRTTYPPYHGPRPLLGVIGSLTLMVIALWYGSHQLALPGPNPISDPKGKPNQITIGLVQPNVNQAQKWDASYRDEILERFSRLSAAVAPQTDLVIWPEAATPFIFEQERFYQQQLIDLIDRQQVPLLFGSPALRVDQNGKRYLLNSAYLLAPQQRLLGRYDKQHLVPFGEYIPLKSSLLFFLEKLVVGIGDFESGKDATILNLPLSPTRPAVQLGVVICYEVIFPDLVRKFAEKGLDFMVTITNDAWFGDSAAPYQHFGMVVLRAVENRVAIARSANTGISGFIDPYGRIRNSTPIFKEAGIQGTIPLSKARSFYSQYGDVFSYSCAIIAGIFILLGWRQRTLPMPLSKGEPHAR